MKKAVLYYQVALEKRREQDARNREFDLKAAACLGVATTVIGLGAVIISMAVQNTAVDVGCGSIVAAAVMAGIYIAMVGCSAKVFWRRTWELAPGLDDFAEHLNDYEDDVLARWAGDQYKKAVTANKEVLARKGRWMEAVFALAVSLPIALVALVVTLAT